MSSRVAFSQPALLRTLSDDEAAAVNVLFADSGLLPIDGLKEYSFAERLSVDGTVYHSGFATGIKIIEVWSWSLVFVIMFN